MRVGVLAVVVGVAVAAVALLSVAGDCAGPPVDRVCQHLTRTLAERLGVASALVTVVLMLTMAGLVRLNGEPAFRARRG